MKSLTNLKLNIQAKSFNELILKLILQIQANEFDKFNEKLTFDESISENGTNKITLSISKADDKIEINKLIPSSRNPTKFIFEDKVAAIYKNKYLNISKCYYVFYNKEEEELLKDIKNNGYVFIPDFHDKLNNVIIETILEYYNEIKTTKAFLEKSQKYVEHRLLQNINANYILMNFVELYETTYNKKYDISNHTTKCCYTNIYNSNLRLKFSKQIEKTIGTSLDLQMKTINKYLSDITQFKSEIKDNLKEDILTSFASDYADATIMSMTVRKNKKYLETTSKLNEYNKFIEDIYSRLDNIQSKGKTVKLHYKDSNKIRRITPTFRLATEYVFTDLNYYSANSICIYNKDTKHSSSLLNSKNIENFTISFNKDILFELTSDEIMTINKYKDVFINKQFSKL